MSQLVFSDMSSLLESFATNATPKSPLSCVDSIMLCEFRKRRKLFEANATMIPLVLHLNII